ncbi:MAG: ABC transporter permease [SAR202 cluster bacterium]|jgi:ABC-type dipeptide/oligopeptide/nickel transport system permease component|nr:ABC transporter permease [SAR202 cluster bacterium]MDP6300394.1 ABC transporter permease [SAR202 cluster bacterium]MDP7103152.1 ABC transporter permease [SAR202 cluster bacterium]MDP7224719.1 ABC transporter permease [SAR202 cluster bacterium]MDP7413987.1 ABC transporter permease [SAR202 cluster bacterium]|tara:strand:- start:3437 stop:4375 length:939 start_codon:yes stop_codon:yes gene_type:complete
MWVYIARRLLWLPFLLVAVSFVTFTLGRFGPGDPVQVILGTRYDPDSEVTKNLEAQFGLDKPFIVQYADYMWGVIRHADFGESYRYRGREVSSLLGSKIWVSFQVNVAAMIVSLGIGLPLGFWIAHKQGSWEDPTAVTTALILMSIPIMVSIPAVLWGMCLKTDLVPCSGWDGFWSTRMIVPAITMGIPGIAGFARFMRASTLDVMGQDFIRTAHAKGLSGIMVDYRHVFKNAMIPIVTLLSFALAGMLGTSFIVERILGIPGVGNFTIDAVFNRDYPVIMAATLLGAGVFVIANLAADIVYSVIDPRIRYQ